MVNLVAEVGSLYLTAMYQMFQIWLINTICKKKNLLCYKNTSRMVSRTEHVLCDVKECNSINVTDHIIIFFFS